MTRSLSSASSASTSWLRRGDLEHPAQQGDVAQVGLDRLGDARVLHLHRDRAAVVGDRAVHLPDRRGGDGFGVPGREDPLRRQAQLFGDDLRGQLRAHRRHAVLQPAQRPAGGGGQAVVDVAGHLAELHQHALHRAQGGGDVLGGLQRQVVPQPLPVLARAANSRGALLAYRAPPRAASRSAASPRSTRRLPCPGLACPAGPAASAAIDALPTAATAATVRPARLHARFPRPNASAR